MSITMSKTDVVRARIEPDTKNKAEEILKRLGVSHSTFINMSYRAVVETGGIPLSLNIPNAETRKVLEEARDPAVRAGYAKFDSVEDLMADLHEESDKKDL